MSPDLTTDNPEKQKDAGGPVWKENTTAEYHCTVISFAESKAQAGVLWAGTDDGNLQLSRDAGKTWSNLAKSVPGVPPFSPVSHVEPSATDPAAAWIAFDRHMFDDPAPYVFRTTDFGRTWTRTTQGLPPEGFVWVVRQDPKNPRLLWAGTELGLHASYDEGRSWQRLHLKNLPTVAVHDVLIHPRENDLILGTHGRALWIFDDATPLQQLDPSEPPRTRLFAVRPALRFPSRFTRYGIGDKAFRGANPAAGALITYALEKRMGAPASPGKDDAAGAAKAKKPERVKVEIVDRSGKLVRTLKAPGLEKGLNRVAWDLRYDPPYSRREGDEPESDFGPPPGGPYALPGTYTVRLTVDGDVHEQPVTVRVDPLVPVTAGAHEAQFEMAQALTELRSGVNRALRALDTVKSQLEERRKLSRQIGGPVEGELERAWTDADKELKELLGTLARPADTPRYATGPRTEERLSALFGSVDGAFAAPTRAQREYFARLQEEARRGLARADDFLKTGLAKLNQALQGAQLAPVVVPRTGT